MLSTLLTKDMVSEVRGIAMAYRRIIDLAFEIDLEGKRTNEQEPAELKRIQINLTGDLMQIAKLVFSGSSERLEDLKEAMGEAGLLVMRCDVTVQMPPITNLYDGARNPPVKRAEKDPAEAPQVCGESPEKGEKIRHLNAILNKRGGSPAETI